MVRACCSKYSARDLRHRITIQRKSRTGDGLGGFVETWADLAEVWAMWSPLSGSEQMRAMRTSPEQRIKAVIRWRGDASGAPYYTPADRVIYRGRTHGVVAVIDVDGAQEWLEMALIEGEPS